MIPIPVRMRHLKVEQQRGFAIPYGVVIDASGVVHFSINDENIRRDSVRKDLCSMCGQRLLRGRWFVGGPLSAFHKHGAFIDPPMHFECSHYALQVCPYLAARRYVKEVGATKAKNQATALKNMAILIDNTMIPGRPRDDVFIAICATGQDVFENFNTKPKHPYLTIEYWRHGTMVERLVGPAMFARVIEETKDALIRMPI